MTPPRLVELQCPMCKGRHWVIDSDFRCGISGTDVPYKKREYACSKCNHRGPGYRVLQKSPPEFLFQLHPVNPGTRRGFKWAGLAVLVVLTAFSWAAPLTPDMLIVGWLVRVGAPIGAILTLRHLLYSSKKHWHEILKQHFPDHPLLKDARWHPRPD